MNNPQDVDIQKHLTGMHIRSWLDGELLQWRWWLLLALLAALLVAWCLLLKKDRLLETCLFAALALTVFMGIDEYGEELTLWDYPTDIIPLFPPMSSLNMLLLPLGFSILFQRFRTAAYFTLAAAALSAAMCFGAEPLLSLAGMYRLVRWYYYESFPIYLLVALGARAAVNKTGLIMGKYQTDKEKREA